MSTSTVHPLAGTYQADPIHSSFGFSVRHSGLGEYRGSISDVSATLRAGDSGLSLEGAARVESISITKPAEFRARVLGADFFDADEHPEVAFRSTRVELADDGAATVEGELTIKGITRPVTAAGSYAGPHGNALALALETSFDRREFGFDWQAELPGGIQMLDWEVKLDIQLRLAAESVGS
jgi:polyisoprenoid-binding protein YceI